MRPSFTASLEPSFLSHITVRQLLRKGGELTANTPGHLPMYVPFFLTVVSIALCALGVAWYYNRAFQSVHYEYLGSGSGMAGRADDIYRSLVRPLRARRLIAIAVATAAFCAAFLLARLHAG